jgi:hypothetical protein
MQENRFSISFSYVGLLGKPEVGASFVPLYSFSTLLELLHIGVHLIVVWSAVIGIDKLFIR